jgi:hypothetical protein
MGYIEMSSAKLVTFIHALSISDHAAGVIRIRSDLIPWHLESCLCPSDIMYIPFAQKQSRYPGALPRPH